MWLINSFKKLNQFELNLWMVSIVAIILSFIFTQSNILILISSLVGVTALIFLAKGLPSGQILTIIFAILYAIVSYNFRYYGEMITYLGMTLPSALITLIIWLKHPYENGKPEVKISKLTQRSIIVIIILSILSTIMFYYILKFLQTPNLVISTASIFTSILASVLMMYRVPYYAIAYAFNDIILICLWILASITNLNYLPMVVCFIIFLINDLYAFKNWNLIKTIQHKSILQKM